jgi:hypothetical protein
MPRLTNRTRETVDFIVKGVAKDGVPPTESLAPGETRDIDAIDNATYRGRLASGMVDIVERGSRSAHAPAAPKE